MLRHLCIADVPALLRIELATQPSPWSREIFEKCLAGAGCEGWGVECDGALVGFVFFSLKPIGEAHLFNLCVDPIFQRRGLGAQLLQCAISKAKLAKSEVMFLEVRRSNKPAIALYLRYGFVQVGKRKNYYPSVEGFREDAITFALELSLV